MRLICLGDVAVWAKSALSSRWRRPLAHCDTGESSCVLFNWEFPCAEACVSRPRPSGSTRRYVSPISGVELVRNWAPALAGLANNHLLDGGALGVLQTLKAFREIGIDTAGGGTSLESTIKPWIWKTNDGVLGVLNWVTPETHPEPPDSTGVGPNLWPGEADAEKQIKALRDLVDWIVVYIHWSDELFSYPRPADRSLAKKLVEWGSDVVVGNHSHVVRGFEEFSGQPVFYGLGNYFFSDVPSPAGGWVRKQVPRNREALVVELNFRRGQKPVWKIHSYCRDAAGTYPDVQDRAVRRFRKTSLPLNRPDYDDWYEQSRARFDRWEKRLHFRLPAMGWRGIANWLTNKSIDPFR